MSHLRHLRVVLVHKWFVLVAGRRVGVSLRRLIVHDLSKLGRAEWGPYRRQFGLARGQSASPDNKEAFKQAFEHHCRVNDHHWQHWLVDVVHMNGRVSQKPLAMSEAATREMVADWMGAGRAYTGEWDVQEWYAANRDKIQVAWDTRERVEEILARA